MKNILETLQGYKTYLTIAIIFVVIIGAASKWWTVPTELYVALVAAAIGFLRSGVKNDVANLGDETNGTDSTNGTNGLMLLAIGVSCLAVGCARFHSAQIQTKADGTKTETRQSVVTFWDSQAQLAKLRASTTDKTQGLTVGGLNEEAASSNAVDVAGQIIGTAIRAAVAGSNKSPQWI
jgi:hypothetical protein